MRLSDTHALTFARVTTAMMLRPFKSIRIKNMHRFLGARGYSFAQCETLDNESMRFQGRLFVENSRLLQMTPRQLQESVRLDGEENLQQALQRGRGALLVASHLGNWLLTATILSTVGYKVSGVAYEIPINSVEAHMKQIWKRYNISIAHVGRDSVRAAKKALELNQIFILVFEASVRPSENVWLPFGDVAIKVDPGPARLALMFHAPILMLRSRPLVGSGSCVSIAPEMCLDELMMKPHKNPEALMGKWLELLHRDVSARPEQWWPWSHIRLAEASILGARTERPTATAVLSQTEST